MRVELFEMDVQRSQEPSSAASSNRRVNVFILCVIVAMLIAPRRCGDHATIMSYTLLWIGMSGVYLSRMLLAQPKTSIAEFCLLGITICFFGVALVPGWIYNSLQDMSTALIILGSFSLVTLGVMSRRIFFTRSSQ